MTYTFNDTQMAELNRLVARYPEGKQKVLCCRLCILPKIVLMDGCLLN